MKIANQAALGVLVLGSLVAGNAVASSGTLNFEGQVTNVTCNVGVNGTGLADATIVLPTVPVSTLASVGATAGRTFIRFELMDDSCGDVDGEDAVPDLVSVFFNANSDVDLTGDIGRLANKATTGAATNVALQIADATGTPLNLFLDATGQSQGVNSVTPQKGAVLTRYVEYYATGAATAGAVQSTAQYDLHYH